MLVDLRNALRSYDKSNNSSTARDLAGRLDGLNRQVGSQFTLDSFVDSNGRNVSNRVPSVEEVRRYLTRRGWNRDNERELRELYTLILDLGGALEVDTNEQRNLIRNQSTVPPTAPAAGQQQQPTGATAGHAAGLANRPRWQQPSVRRDYENSAAYSDDDAYFGNVPSNLTGTFILRLSSRRIINLQAAGIMVNMRHAINAGDVGAESQHATEASNLFANLRDLFLATWSLHLIDVADWLSQSMEALDYQSLWQTYGDQPAQSYQYT